MEIIIEYKYNSSLCILVKEYIENIKIRKITNITNKKHIKLHVKVTKDQNT